MFQKKSKRYKKLLIYLVLLLSIIFLYKINQNNYEVPSSLPPVEKSEPAKEQESLRLQKETVIVNTIKSTLEGKPDSYAVFIKDLNNQQDFAVSADQSFASASIYKLAVMYKTYDSIEKGELKADDVLSAGKTALNRIISGNSDKENLRLEDNQDLGNISLSVENALENMITISDNYSALLLAQKLGWSNIDSFIKSQNIQNFNLIGANSPNVTAHAVGNLLEKIYRETAVNRRYSQEMKNLLLAQEVNDRIPKYLPKDVEVAHKTGELEEIRHDAGIVFGNNSDYIFVFLSQTPKPEEAIETIALLSQQIFEVLEKSAANPDTGSGLLNQDP